MPHGLQYVTPLIERKRSGDAPKVAGELEATIK
jgi:hypothetical protein